MSVAEDNKDYTKSDHVADRKAEDERKILGSDDCDHSFCTVWCGKLSGITNSNNSFRSTHFLQPA